MEALLDIYFKILQPALIETLSMVIQSTIYSILLGFIPAIILVVTSPNGLKPQRTIYRILDFIVNVLRSFPFLILMICLIPITRRIVGTSIGTAAAIVPLSIGAAPFAARVIESSLMELDRGVIEAAKSFGASNIQIIFKVMLKEALPSIVQGITLTLISIVGYSAMAGTIGGGGLGNVAMKYGYHRYETQTMIYTVILLIILVQFFQTIGNLVYKALAK